MKKTLAVIAGLALAGVAQSFAANQATVALNNYAGGVINYQATAGGATTLLPADAWVEVLGGATGSTASLGVFHPSEPGYFDNGVVLVPGATAGQSASFEVRAWTGATTYAAATVKGSTGAFSSATGSWDDAATPPPVKQGPDLAVPTFTVAAGSTPVVPEPSTIALGVLGAAALLARRRK